MEFWHAEVQKINQNIVVIVLFYKIICFTHKNMSINRQEIDTKRVIGLSKTLEIGTYNKSHSFDWLLFSINTNYLLKSFLS